MAVTRESPSIRELAAQPPVAAHRRFAGRRLARLALHVARLRAPWAIVTAGLALYALGFLVFAVADLDLEPATRGFIGDAAFLPPGILVALLAWRAATAPGLSQPARRAWTWLGLAYISFWAGDALYFWFDRVTHEVPYPSLADGAYLAYYPFLLVGLLSFPRILRAGSSGSASASMPRPSLGGRWSMWLLVLGPWPRRSRVTSLPPCCRSPIRGRPGPALGFAVIALRAASCPGGVHRPPRRPPRQSRRRPRVRRRDAGRHVRAGALGRRALHRAWRSSA